MKKRILVTGGAGFIGSNFCNINKEKFDVVALDNFFLGDRKNLDDDIVFFEGDANKREDLEQCGAEFDAVVHFAGTSSGPMFTDEGLAEGYRNSLESFCNSMTFAHKVGATKFLYASTSSIYGNNPMPLTEDQQVTPPNHYAVTKFCYEHCARIFTEMHPGFETVGFRFMSVYGPNEEAKGMYANVVTQFIWDFARGKSPLIFGDGTQYRDFTNVADVVQGITKAIEAEPGVLKHSVFNIGTGEFASLNEIIELIKKHLGTDMDATYIENPVKESYIQGQQADISHISSMLGYNPTITLDEGVKFLCEQVDTARIRETSSDKLRLKLNL